MNNTSGIKNFLEYLPQSIKFHKLKNEGLAKIIFVLVLLFQLIGNYIQYRAFQLMSSEDIDKIASALMGVMPSESESAIPSEHTIYLLLIVLG
ncbi:MAG: hypothetical protein ACYDG2_09735, partial [Ruminiclostridium sp.]